MKASSSTKIFLCSHHHFFTNGIAPPLYIAIRKRFLEQWEKAHVAKFEKRFSREYGNESYGLLCLMKTHDRDRVKQFWLVIMVDFCFG